jgi:hypothetical protein
MCSYGHQSINTRNINAHNFLYLKMNIHPVTLMTVISFHFIHSVLDDLRCNETGYPDQSFTVCLSFFLFSTHLLEGNGSQIVV